jgi:hypothetical protein
MWVWYGLLCAACLVGWVNPLDRFLAIESVGLRLVAAGVQTFLPIYFANILFSTTFHSRDVAEYVFGWNLIGAMFGGLVEYASLLTGYNFLTLIVVACYTGTFIFLRTTLPARRPTIHP